MKPLFVIALLVLEVIAGSATAMEVQTPGGPPGMTVQVPDTAIVEPHPGQTTIYLAPGTLPILTIGVAAFDPAKADLAAPAFYAALASDILKGMSQGLGGGVVNQTPGSRVFIGGKSGWIFRGAIENQGGGQMTVEVVTLMIDPSHVGLFGLVSVQGREGVGGLESAMRSATMTTP